MPKTWQRTHVLKSIAGRKKSGFEMTSEYIVETQQLKLLGHADIMSLAIAAFSPAWDSCAIILYFEFTREMSQVRWDPTWLGEIPPWATMSCKFIGTYSRSVKRTPPTIPFAPLPPKQCCQPRNVGNVQQNFNITFCLTQFVKN